MFNLYKNIYPADWYIINDVFNNEEYKQLF